MIWMTYIIEALNSVSNWFYNLYLQCYYAGWPLDALCNLFYSLCTAFNTLAWNFSGFYNTIDDMLRRIDSYLNWEGVWGVITYFVPNLLSIRDWFYNWWSNVTSAITSWWSAMQYQVQGWIAAAVATFQSQLNNLATLIATVQQRLDHLNIQFPDVSGVLSWFSNWWGNVLVQLGTWWAARLLDVQGLINSAFLSRDSWWAGWADVRTIVLTFFSNPLDFLWQRFADWFLGPEG